jgi:predicted 2-oxoglutarate/Fe(II)-dependent dioxygenase YbiX
MFDGNRKGIPTLSIVGVLNDDYEGGEFIMWQDTEIKLKTGDVLIFPSNFLYPHKVNLVTEGTRYSLVSWTW